jgi:hypothetical protein
MLNIHRSGISLADAAASVANAPAGLVPYAAATALTRVAQQAMKVDIPAAMRASFNNPVPYTLNSLRVEPATKDTLSARVMVKTEASGHAPENFLAPQVLGGQRGHKGLEGALRYAGVLGSSQFAVPGQALSLDANGNVKGAEVRTILATLKNIQGGVGAKGQRAGKGKRLSNSLFAGKPNGGDRPAGIWRREGQRLRPLFIFTDQAPRYSERLDFDGVVMAVARERFQPEFEKAMAAMVARGVTKA